ncbi:hypothetical protein ACGFNP_42315 [Nonomuraea sp. NPDC049269]|uniref:hypothetical protein n=1 Tax=Nonomuraea sp. NPDC049269 TaxID=3364349 RepID=UPI0037135B26
MNRIAEPARKQPQHRPANRRGSSMPPSGQEINRRRRCQDRCQGADAPWSTATLTVEVNFDVVVNLDVGVMATPIGTFA